MSFSIPITQNNISNTQNNSQWQYNFLNGAFRMQNMEMCISTVSIPYSWYNVTSLNGNNSFNYTWWDGTVYNIVLPDGFYGVPDIQDYIQTAKSKGLNIFQIMRRHVFRNALLPVVT